MSYWYLLPKKIHCQHCKTKKQLHIGLVPPEPMVPYISCPECGTVYNIDEYDITEDMILKYLIEGEKRRQYRP